MGNCYAAPVTNHSPSTPASAPSESVETKPPKLKEFSLAELKKCTRRFRPDIVAGKGGFGRVFKGWVNEDTYAPSRFGIGMAVAVKKANPCQGHHREWQAEVNFLGKYRHPNLVRPLRYCCEKNQFLLVYEYMQKGSLENHLFIRKGQEPLRWELRLQIAIGAARSLAFLHTENVVYRDFKASNILLDSAYNAKLSNFGLAKVGPINVNSYVIGTIEYTAPEYVGTGICDKE